MKMKMLPLLTLLFLAACKQEDAVFPKIKSSITSDAVLSDTLPAKAAIKLKLFQDSVISDETALVFQGSSSANYVPGEDAPYFTGYGKVHFASVSGDGEDLAINYLPYTHGIVIKLNASTANDGAFGLKLSYVNNIPANVQIWLKDKYLKDSINIRKGNYTFNVRRADTNSFGNKRFTITFARSAQQQ